MKYILLTILLCLGDISFGQAVWNGYTYNAPVCNKPNCQMCNTIRAQLAAQSTPNTIYETRAATNDTVRYETRAVTKQVKRCNGRTCWYENVTEYIQVPISTPVQNTIPFRSSVPTPVKNDISLDLVPTPQDAVDILVDLLRPTPNDIFIEPGCGDGRVLKIMSKFCESIGIELNPNTAELAQRNVGKDALVLHQDATQADYTRATIVSMYLYPDVMEKIVPLLQPGTRIVSYCHSIPGIKCKEYTANGHTFYIGAK